MEKIIYKDLKEYLTRRQRKLLKMYLENRSLTEYQRQFNISKSDVFLEFIYLGQRIGFYRLLVTKFSKVLMAKKTKQGFTQAISYMKKVISKKIEIKK